MHQLTIHLDLPLRRSEIRYFRGAIAERAGLEHDLFHNHRDGHAHRYHYRYPLIQYQARQGRAVLVGIDAGADTLRSLLDTAAQTFCGDLPVFQWRDESRPVGMTQEPRTYALRQWLALNAANYARYLALPDETARHTELERILVAHLLAFSQGVGFTVPRPRGLELRIIQTSHPRLTRCHDGKLLAFDIAFEANMELPDGVGIGKAASHGYGTLWPTAVRQPQHHTRQHALSAPED